MRSIKEMIGISEKKKEREVYSVGSLISDITGESKLTSQAYDARRQEVYRAVKLIRSVLAKTDHDQGVPKIHKDDKERFVALMKDFIEDHEFMDLLKRLQAGKELTEEQYDFLIEKLVQNLSLGKSDEEQVEIREEVEKAKEENWYDLADDIISKVHTDLMLIRDIHHIDTRLDILKEYDKIFEDSLAAWRANVSTFIPLQEILAELIEENPEISPLDGVISEEGLTPEVLAKIFMKLCRPS